MKRYFICIAAAAALMSGIFFAGNAQQKTPQGSHDTAVLRNLTIFNEIVRMLENTYVDTIRPDKAFEAAIGAMLNTVDPYTEYYNSDDKEKLMQMTTGVYGGIGAFIMTRDGSTFISQPIEGTPSFRAGLRAGDKILKVDTVDVSKKASDVVTKYLKGEPGTLVSVTVARPFTEDSILTFDITRERVREKSVPYYGVTGGNIGYIRLNSFMEKSPEEVEEALKAFQENPKVEGIVLDLRGNGGGLVESAVEILGFFLPKGTEVIETKGRDKNAHKTYKTTKNPLFPEMPLAVLIDGGSASASEITAGALQDLDRAVLIGNRSFGKGLVQGTYQLPYDGLLKVTTAKYYIPSGRLIQALDYSHRNPDGSVARTPDSLTNEFKTRNGRIVRDGGGLIPDTTVTLKDFSRLIYNLVAANQIFDYATKFHAEHPEIAAPGEFEITDEIFEDFVASVDTTKVKSEQIGKLMVDELRKTAKTEGFMSDKLVETLDALEALVQPELKDVMQARREEINEFLGREIITRYYSQKGEEEYGLKFDEELEVASGILNDKALYKKLLNLK